MGLGLLPWERLPAYVFGPLICALNIFLLLTSEKHTFWDWFWESCGLAFGIWIIWYRYTSGNEPFAELKNKNTAENLNDIEIK